MVGGVVEYEIWIVEVDAEHEEKFLKESYIYINIMKGGKGGKSSAIQWISGTKWVRVLKTRKQYDWQGDLVW